MKFLRENIQTGEKEVITNREDAYYRMMGFATRKQFSDLFFGEIKEIVTDRNKFTVIDR